MREGLAATLDLARQELQAQGIQVQVNPASVAQEVEYALYIFMGTPKLQPDLQLSSCTCMSAGVGSASPLNMTGFTCLPA